MNDIEDVVQAICIGSLVANFLLNTGRAPKAIEICKECLIFLHTKALGKEKQFGRIVYGAIYNTMFRAYSVIPDYKNAIKYGRETIAIYRECGDTAKEGNITIALADIYQRRCEYVEARELYERAISSTEENGDRKGQAHAYGKFGTMFCCLGENVKAKEYLGKALAIRTDIGDRAGEATSYGNLGTVFKSLGEYEKAREYLEKALAINIEIGDREGEAADYGNLGTVFHSLGEYKKAKEYLEKALATNIEIHDRVGEATNYGNLGSVFKSLGEYDKANEFHEKALAIRMKIGDRAGEATDYGNQGIVFQFLGEYDKAKKHHEKALAIKIEIGDRAGIASCYGNLGTVFQSLGEYDKAKEYHKKALAIRMEIGDRAGEARYYGNQGTVLHSIGEYDKAKEYHEKALAIIIEIGDRAGEATCYGNLGTVFQSLCEYDKAKEYQEKALTIIIEIGDRAGEATCYGNLGTVFQSLCEYDKAREYLEKALAIRIEIGDREGEAADYGNLGTLFHSLGEHVVAQGYLEKALSISQDTGNAENEYAIYRSLTMAKLSQEKIQEALHYLYLSMKKSEELRSFLRENDKFKISFSDVHDFPYRYLSAFFCFYGNPNNALYVLELGRARALADLMVTQYSVEREISANPQTWIGIETIMKKERKCNCVCLYISFDSHGVFLWILKTSGVIHFRRITVDENITDAGLFSSLGDFLTKSIRSSGILSQQNCEDRSLNGIELEPKFSQEEILPDLRLVRDHDDDIQDPEPSLPLLYKMIIAPVADLLEEPEIIIVPDRFLYQVPFAALTNEGGKYLSETFRIRTVPSLTTLKLIQDSPADYHSQTGALIVGDPVVGRVRYNGRRKTFLPLPCARKEAEMIGELLGVQPLLGEHATKQAVLERLQSVSLIHFAAHGSAERGEIALSPLCTTSRIPREEDFLLTMSDISQVRLRAKLAVLSCCHSGCGQIRVEGVVGIARAFLGSGARSVLVALWAIQDSATEQFMKCFYEHLVCGESASESLHKAMKWMRDNGFPKVSEWAPFMLIGDNVTFDTEKLKKARELEPDPACSKQ